MLQDGKTALHLAAIHDSVEIVQLLLDKGFPVDDTDKKVHCSLYTTNSSYYSNTE